MTLQREPCRWTLPARRRSETFEISFGGLAKTHTVTVGFYPDGEVGEVFIAGGKSGEQVAAIARDGAILLSMVLQHRVPLAVVQRAVTRDGQGVPQSIVGAVIDRLVELVGMGIASASPDIASASPQAPDSPMAKTHAAGIEAPETQAVETGEQKTHAIEVPGTQVAT
ncbi:hypothetical protein ABIF78_007691 [Bradyrhizobium japonicum]